VALRMTPVGETRSPLATVTATLSRGMKERPQRVAAGANTKLCRAEIEESRDCHSPEADGDLHGVTGADAGNG
jgi:hypothetical protein